MVGTLEPIHLALDKAAPKPTTQNRSQSTRHPHTHGVQSWNVPLKASIVSLRHSAGPRMHSRSAFMSTHSKGKLIRAPI